MIDMKNCTPLWRSIFWSKHVEAKKESKHVILGAFLKVEMKKCALLWCPAARTLFWNLRCRKSPRRCRAKHTKHAKITIFWKCRYRKSAVWREAHVNECTKPPVRTIFLTIRWRFKVEKLHAVVVRSTIWTSKVLKYASFEPLWCVGCRFVHR